MDVGRGRGNIDKERHMETLFWKDRMFYRLTDIYIQIVHIQR